jgi:hypothetical protein
VHPINAQRESLIPTGRNIYLGGRRVVVGGSGTGFIGIVASRCILISRALTPFAADCR